MTAPPPPPMPSAPPSGADGGAARAAFLAAVHAALESRTLRSLVLSKPRGGGDAGESVRARLIEVRGAPALSLLHRHPTRDVTENHDPEAGLAAIARMLGERAEPAFGHATLETGAATLQLLTSKRGRQTLRRRAALPAADVDAAAADAAAASAASDVGPAEADPAPLAAHDRSKRRALSLALPFWVDLGLADAEHRLIPSMARKWRQIDKFIEVLDGALDAAGVAGDETLKVVDFGSGKGYLTFAAYAHLLARFGRPPEVTGVELRADLVALCNRAAERSGLAGLRFVQGDLQSVAPAALDVMIALHACDTATDHALDLGLRGGARVLLCSPCCHKELRPQLGKPAPLAPLLRHGIHLGQHAEMVTDSLRALLLEASGYAAKVFEFVALEHTSKNKMLLATRRAEAGDPGLAWQQVDALKAFYGVREQRLERLLRPLSRTERS